MGQACSWVTGSYKPVLYTAADSIQRLRVKTANNQKDVHEQTIKQFIQERCPSLLKPFTPVWYLNSGHLQTAYCVVGDFSKIDKVIYDRTLVRLKDGGTLGLDSTPPARERVLADNVPIVVIMHGLTGGSHESYVRAVLSRAIKPKEEGGLGFRGIVVNFRGCAGVKLTTGQLYSAGHTDDLRQALVYIAHRYPEAPLYGIGFSLGANVIVRYLSEEGDKSRLRAACVLGCPWDLLLNSNRLENSFFLRNVYSKAMAQNLINLLSRHTADVEKMGEDRLTPIIPEIMAMKKPTLAEFDNTITRVVGGSSPPFPLPSAEAYYRWASSDHHLTGIRVPLLAFNAEDDPVVGHCPTDVGNNGYVALAVTKGGGHLGWFETTEDGNVRRWVTRPVLEWLRAVHEDVEGDALKSTPIIQEEEWLIEAGREHLGIRLLEDVGEIVGVEGEEGLLAGL